jgi:hypothetical protein
LPDETVTDPCYRYPYYRMAALPESAIGFLLGNGETTLKEVAAHPEYWLFCLYYIAIFYLAQLCFTATVFSCEEMAVIYCCIGNYDHQPALALSF